MRNISRTLPNRPPSKMRGVSLIEVMISVLVLGVGLLGVAALQAAALRNSGSALDRSQAVIQTYSILDVMRANLTVARAGGYNIALAGTAGGNALVASDLAQWRQSLGYTHGPSADGAINCVVTVCTITLQWDDSRGTHDPGAEASPYQVVTVSQL